MRVLTVFRGLFAGLRSSLDTTFGSIINKTVFSSLRLWYFFFEFLCTKLLSARRTSSLYLIREMQSGTRRPSPGSGKMSRQHHNEGILASIQLKNSLSENPKETCNRYQYLSTSHDSGGIAYVYSGKTQVTTGAGLPMSTHWKDMSYESILVMQPTDLLRGFINRFCNEICAERAPVTIRSWWE